jgi:hypothetical protein
MKKLILGLVFLGLIPWRGAAAQTVQNDGLVREIGPEWKSMYIISPDARYNAIEMVPKGQTLPHSAKGVTDFKEVVLVEDFSGASKHSAEDTMNELAARDQKKCPGTIQLTVLAKDESSVLYRWHSDPCGKSPEEAAVCRVIVGRYSRYVLWYMAKVHELAPDVRDQWIKRFSNATFDSVTLSFDPAWMSVDVDEVVPFAMDKVAAALKPAMENQECKVAETAAERIKCKCPKVKISFHEASGDESVTAVLEAKGDQTEVRITTDMRTYGPTKKNWSTPIFEGMLKNLQTGQP